MSERPVFIRPYNNIQTTNVEHEPHINTKTVWWSLNGEKNQYLYLSYIICWYLLFYNVSYLGHVLRQ